MFILVSLLVLKKTCLIVYVFEAGGGGGGGLFTINNNYNCNYYGLSSLEGELTDIKRRCNVVFVSMLL